MPVKPHVSIKDTPWQQLQPQVQQFAQRTRFQQASAEREYLGGQQEVDDEVLAKTLARRSPQGLQILQYLMTGASWVAENLYRLDRAKSSKCLLCGQEETDLSHGLWQCQPVRTSVKELYADPQAYGQFFAQSKKHNASKGRAK